MATAKKRAIDRLGEPPMGKAAPGHAHPEYEMAEDHAVFYEHGHEYATPEHTHDHVHEHQHDAVPKHSHDHDHAVPKHDHGDLRGNLRGTVRALLLVFEGGALNTAQAKALYAVRVIIGDAHGSACAHENTAYEEGDVLVCQDCRAKVTLS